MNVMLLREPATEQHIAEMLQVHETFIKVAVDIRQEILAGGGEFHADCEALLAEEGSHRRDVWGADWLPTERVVRYSALINIRPRVNPGMEIRDDNVRRVVERVVRRWLERP